MLLLLCYSLHTGIGFLQQVSFQKAHVTDSSWERASGDSWHRWQWERIASWRQTSRGWAQEFFQVTAAITSFCSWHLRFDLWRVVFLCFHILTISTFIVVTKHHESDSPYSSCKLVTTLPVNVKCLHHPYLFNKKQQSWFCVNSLQKCTVSVCIENEKFVIFQQ